MLTVDPPSCCAVTEIVSSPQRDVVFREPPAPEAVDEPAPVGHGTNDPPQVWVEVDLTKPQVQLQEVYVGRGSEGGRLAIAWRAADKNLSPRPITICGWFNLMGFTSSRTWMATC